MKQKYSSRRCFLLGTAAFAGAALVGRKAEARKEVLGEKTATVVKKYERSVSKIKYQQIKDEFERQQRSWNLLVRRYA